MKHIGFITCSQLPTLTESDSCVIEPLNKLGVHVEPVIWSTLPTSLSHFDALVMRSAWDYHEKSKAFIDFLTTLKKMTIPLYNPIDCMLWNMNKSYLLDLSKNGVHTIPTIIIDTLDETLWTTISAWPEIIVKPIIGASASGIKKIITAHKDAVESLIKESLQSGPVLIQPFIHRIKEGELSFIFFNKKYSHAVLKTPKKNDYRSQSEFGATTVSVSPEKSLIDQAQLILEHIPYPLLYARLDAIEMRGILYLMELELIEPDLFLRESKAAPSLFADAIARSI